jgi:hypothetical protein
MLTTLLALHAAALAGLLAFARRDAVLVDDDFRPIAGDWLESRVERQQAEAPVAR